MELQIIQRKIYEVRGQKVMLDFDLAELYEVETRVLKQAVKRNLDIFPDDFMFELKPDEWKLLTSQFVIFEKGQGKGKYPKFLPFAFTEHGILMLSSVLNSERAVEVNIQIMRTFTKLRRLMIERSDLRKKIEEMERKYDSQFRVVFKTIKELLEPLVKKKAPIGFHSHESNSD